jgi:hypothetical protein
MVNDESTLRRIATNAGVPAHLIDGLMRYRFEGLRTGDFLMSVLSNDLHAAVQYADPVSLHALVALTRFLYFEFPAASWGSHEAVAHWTGAEEPRTGPERKMEGTS